MRTRFHPDARLELLSLADELDADVSARLVLTVRDDVRATARTPHAGAPWPSLPADLEVRRRALPGFRFLSLAYVALDDTLWIVALVHSRRRPGYWRARLRDLPR